jgi:hypothetical protein
MAAIGQAPGTGRFLTILRAIAARLSDLKRDVRSAHRRPHMHM